MALEMWLLFDAGDANALLGLRVGLVSYASRMAYLGLTHPELFADEA